MIHTSLDDCWYSVTVDVSADALEGRPTQSPTPEQLEYHLVCSQLQNLLLSLFIVLIGPIQPPLTAEQQRDVAILQLSMQRVLCDPFPGGKVAPWS